MIEIPKFTLEQYIARFFKNLRSDELDNRFLAIENVTIGNISRDRPLIETILGIGKLNVDVCNTDNPDIKMNFYKYYVWDPNRFIEAYNMLSSMKDRAIQQIIVITYAHGYIWRCREHFINGVKTENKIQNI